LHLKTVYKIHKEQIKTTTKNTRGSTVLHFILQY